MIKVTIMYPNQEGKKFDFGYWTTTHLEMVQKLLGPMGLVKGEMEKGISGTDPSAPPTYVAIGHLYFNTVKEVHEAFKAHAGTIMGDTPNYCDVQPQIQLSETLL